jgi:hypothetical protein
MGGGQAKENLSRSLPRCAHAFVSNASFFRVQERRYLARCSLAMGLTALTMALLPASLVETSLKPRCYPAIKLNIGDSTFVNELRLGS